MQIFLSKICGLKNSAYICSPNAEIAQLVEHDLAKVGVASSSLVFRSMIKGNVNFLGLHFLFLCKVVYIYAELNN